MILQLLALDLIQACYDIELTCRNQNNHMHSSNAEKRTFTLTTIDGAVAWPQLNSVNSMILNY